MFALAHIQFQSPVTLLCPARRRVISPAPSPPGSGVARVFSGFDLAFVYNPQFRLIHTQFAGIPGALQIYTAEDWPAVVGDTPDLHAARTLQVLGSDPASVLQALLDGTPPPPMPPRIPRELPNWRIKAVLAEQGLLAAAEAALEWFPEPQRTIARLAWNGDAKLSRTSPAVAFIAGAIGLTDQQMDQAFIAAESLVI